MGVADRRGVGDDRAHLAVVDPKVSAAINAIEAREPPISGLPVATRMVPSALTWTLALDSPPPLNQ